MGVHGLWRLIGPTGQPVPLETLENKVLAVDISIWLHQAVKGFQDSKGAPLPNAHLLGIFHRVCKLLYYRIKPVFVFDGGVPVLKRDTISKRNQLKTKNVNEANLLQKQLLNSLLKHSAINAVLSETVKANLEKEVEKPTKYKDRGNDMYQLPQVETAESRSDDESSSSISDDDAHHSRNYDLHTIDARSAQFKSLPVDVRHEILTELKETRKQSSWGRLHELPKKSDDFAVFQIDRLLKRHSVQVSLEEAEKEMGGHSLSLGELEMLLQNDGVITSTAMVSGRIASDENKRYIYIRNLKEAIQEAKAKETIEEDIDGSKLENQGSNEGMQDKADEELEKAIRLSLQNESTTSNDTSTKCDSEENASELSHKIVENITKTKADLEYEADLEEAIRLSLQNEATTSKHTFDLTSNESMIYENDNSSDDGSDTEMATKVMASAKHYMTEYSGLTPSEILKVINGNAAKSDHSKTNINEVISIAAEDNSTEQSGEVTASATSISEINNDEIKITNTVCDSSSSVETTIDINRPNITNIQDTHKDTDVLMSDSDSDNDFLEVETSLMNANEERGLEKEPQKVCSQQPLQIIIEKMSELEDDLFSDVFKGDKNNENSTEEIFVESSTDKEVEIPETATENTLAILKNNMSTLTNSSIEDKTKESQTVSESIVSNIGVNVNEATESTLLEDILQPLKAKDKSKPALTAAKLKKIQEDLVEETNQLRAEKSTKDRLASNITEQMYQEAQELLQLFGVPYITAPMEAESQCAFLNEVNLTDGTITDDSDIWLFGGKTVYKNFFNQSKNVLEFQSDSIQHSFKLSRYEMILLALLVGSDYTTGIQGIGPVTALEILAAFPPQKNELTIGKSHLISGLKEFRKWFSAKHTIKSTRIALRNKLRNIVISEQFPSLQVVQAYLDPSVDTSKEAFSWQKPDLETLVEFARHKFGWNHKKSEEILKPVLKRLDETAVQTKITNYFKAKHKIQGDAVEEKMSKRVKKAVTKMGADSSTSSETDAKVAKEKNTTSRKTKKKPAEDNAKVPAGEEVKVSKGTKKNTTSRKTKPKSTTRKEKGPDAAVDEEVKVLQETKKLSRHKIKEMKIALNEMLLKAEAEEKAGESGSSSFFPVRLHRPEVIPQKEKDKADSLRNKLKAIEVFRKSKRGPGFLKKRQRNVQHPKEDAGLSESSDS